MNPSRLFVSVVSLIEDDQKCPEKKNQLLGSQASLFPMHITPLAGGCYFVTFGGEKIIRTTNLLRKKVLI
jgi:hypothetical protein